MDKEDKIMELLHKGLEYYGYGDFEQAKLSWYKALIRDPGNKTAEEYLLDADMPLPTSDLISMQEINFENEIILEDQNRQKERKAFREKLKSLMAGQHYEEALRFLSKAEKDGGEDPEAIKKSIYYIKNKLAFRSEKEIGSLYQRVETTVTADVFSELTLNTNVRTVVDLIKNQITIADLIKTAKIDKYIVLYIIKNLKDRGLINLLGEIKDRPKIQSRLKFDLSQLNKEDSLLLQELSGKIPQNPTKSINKDLYKVMERRAAPDRRQKNRRQDEPPQKSLTEQHNEEFSKLFKEATHAYICKDITKALELFERCQELRPEDTRIKHNIARIKGGVS